MHCKVARIFYFPGNGKMFEKYTEKGNFLDKIALHCMTHISEAKFLADNDYITENDFLIKAWNTNTNGTIS